MRNGPDYIQFYPTLRCNRSCDFCFNRSLPVVPDMSLKDCRAMFTRLKSAGVKTIDIIGGESTMHPDITQIIREAGSQGFGVTISSNGSNLESLEEISKADDKVSIGISINDRETLEECSAFIKKRRPVVKSVFSPAMDQGLVHEILALDPKKFYVIYRDALDRNDLPAAVSFHRFMRVVEERFNSANVGMVYCSGFIPDREHYPELEAVRCPAGTTKLGIMPDGSVYPCNLLFGNKAFFLGNILADAVATIWDHAALAFFRTFTGNACPERTCALHGQCHGGCPAHALLLSGDIAAPDSRCAEA
jgi:radical SAM protein with 4Fe4S-binding SPASM domain